MTNPFRLATDSYGAVRPSYPRAAVEKIVEGAEASKLTIADV
ncbi:MAG: SAM-dependent methyltransferase, partial [Actinomyces sp.]|nr:SAM-dependent methyltransferase [Actinomyces sp.]